MKGTQRFGGPAGQFVDFLPPWFNSKWIGRALKRLGFNEKRRCGRGVEYRLTPGSVQDMAVRLGVELPTPTPEEIAKKAAEEAAQKKAEAVDAAAKLEAADAAAKAVDAAAKAAAKTKPQFMFKSIPSAEKCGACSSFAVTKVVLTPQGSTLRKCEECFKKLQTAFPNANFSREGAS